MKAQSSNKEKEQILWSDTARSPRLFVIDARALIPLSIWLLHICWETFYVGMIGVIIFAALERFNITPKTALLIIKTKLIGRRRVNYDFTVFRRRSRT